MICLTVQSFRVQAGLLGGFDFVLNLQRLLRGDFRFDFSDALVLSFRFLFGFVGHFL